MDIPPGQMSSEEREYIYNLVYKIKPKKVIESGTWKGGGSTLSIVRALYDNNFGILYTFEENKEFYDIAKNFYDNSCFSKNIKLYNEDFVAAMRRHNSLAQETDIFLLDGGDELPDGTSKLELHKYLENYDLSENVQSFKILENKIKIGTHILLHDWTIEIGRGNFIKRYLEETKNENFYLENVIDTTTGLAHLVKIK